MDRPLVPRSALVGALVLLAFSGSRAFALQEPHDVTGALVPQWEALLDSQTSNHEAPLDLVVRDGRAYVTGTSRRMQSSSSLWFTCAYDLSTGAELWRALESDEHLHGQEGRAIALSADGAVAYVAGTVWTDGVGVDLRLVAYDAASGARVWGSTHGDPIPNEVPRAIGVDPASGAVYVAGSTSVDMLTVAFAGGTGAALWARTFDVGGDFDWANDLAVSDGGGAVYVTGRGVVGSPGSIGAIATLAYDASGAELWHAIEPGASAYAGEGRAIAAQPGGAAVFVAGELTGADDVFAYAAADGAPLWSASMPGGAAAVTASADGARVFVAGASGAGDGDLRAVAYDAAGGAVLWSTDWDRPFAYRTAEAAVDLALSSAGTELFACGTTTPFGGAADVLTVAFEAASGAVRWARIEGGPGADVSVAAGAGGGLALAAAAVMGDLGAADATTFAYAGANGTDAWSSTLALTVSADNTPRALLADAGRVYVTGERCCAQRAETAAFDAASGAELWSAIVGAEVEGLGLALALDPAGARLFAAGTRDGDLYCVAYDPSNGAELWLAIYDGPEGGVDRGLAVAASPDGTRVFVTGTSESSGIGVPLDDYVTAAFDAATGAVLWTARHDVLGQSDQPVGLAVAPDGVAVYVSGTSAPSVYYDLWGNPWPDFDYGTLAYDAATGAPLWVSYHDGPGALPSLDLADDVGLSPDGTRLFVTGHGGDPYAFATVALDTATGTELWVATHESVGATHALPAALAVDPTGARVYVAGRTNVQSFPYHANFAAFAYDAATGAELWAHIDATDSEDALVDVGVEPDGTRVFLTGTRATPAFGQLDVVTLVRAASTGAFRGEAAFDDPLLSTGAASALAVDPTGRRVFVAASQWGGATGVDVLLLSYGVPVLATDVAAVSLASGGNQAFGLNADAVHGGLPYWIFGSISGTSPGIPVGGVTLPLVFDAYLKHTLLHPFQPPLAGAVGSLDALGAADAGFLLPVGLPASAAGLELNHAALVFALPLTGQAVLASNPVPLTLEP